MDKINESEINDIVYSAPDCIRTGDLRMTEDELNRIENVKHSERGMVIDSFTEV